MPITKSPAQLFRYSLFRSALAAYRLSAASIPARRFASPSVALRLHDLGGMAGAW